MIGVSIRWPADGQHAPCDLRIARIGREVGHTAVVVVDLEHDAVASDLDQAEVVLAVRIVVGGEAVERLDCRIDRNFGFGFECGDAAGHDECRHPGRWYAVGRSVRGCALLWWSLVLSY